MSLNLRLLARFRRLHAASLLAFLVAAACVLAWGRPTTPVTSDVYVWQRAWHPALHDAVRQATDLTHAWHVLGAEVTPQGSLRPVAVDFGLMTSTARPVVLVVRIDGQLAGLDGGALVRDIVALHQRWRASGLAMAGVEIDHDCGTARLPAYALWLADLRHGLGAATPLSITALPAWLASPALERVLAQADESVLQVHAVRQPRYGLFDPGLALQWTADYARRVDRPFRVALPTYGTRVGFDAAGVLTDIESESATLRGASERRELSVSPAAVADFMAQVRANPPAHWTGWVWFRLPTADDQRAWRLSTWREVVQGHPLRAVTTVDWRPAEVASVYDVMLLNCGETDADTPARVTLPAGCSQADGANGYHLAVTPTQRFLDADDAGLLHPHASRVIGWMRCDAPPSPET
jgi:hypothetical protein